MNLKEFFWPTKEKLLLFGKFLICYFLLVLFLNSSVMASMPKPGGCIQTYTFPGVLQFFSLIIPIWIVICALQYMRSKNFPLSTGLIGFAFFFIIGAFLLLGWLFFSIGMQPFVGNFSEISCNANSPVKNLINEAVKNPGSPRASMQNVKFVQGELISPSAIVSGTGITSDQICILKGEHESTQGFEFKGKSLFYVGHELNASLEVLCNSASALQNNLDEIYSTQFDHSLVADGDNVRCGNACLDGNATCCAIILKYAK